MPTKNHRIIIFDYGGVISKPQSLKCIRKIIKKLGLQNEQDFRNLYSIHRKDIDSGKLSLKEYWEKTLMERKMNLNPDDLAWLVYEDIVSWADINEDTLNLIRELKENGHTLAILSNMVTETLVYLQNNTSFIGYFDYPYFSCELNMIKPNPGLYQYILDDMKTEAHNCIFIDDLAVNCEAAEKTGMQVIQFRNVKQLWRDLRMMI